MMKSFLFLVNLGEDRDVTHKTLQTATPHDSTLGTHYSDTTVESNQNPTETLAHHMLS